MRSSEAAISENRDQMNRKFRLAGWLAVGGLLAAALLAPASVAATDLHAAHQGTGWDAEGFQSNDCVTRRTRPGRLALRAHHERDSGHLTATFDKAGDKTVANIDQPVDMLHFGIVTGHDTLLDAETTDVDGGNLNLSHICVGRPRQSTLERRARDGLRPRRDRDRSPPRPPSSPPRPRSVPAETASVPAETAAVPAETASVPVEQLEPARRAWSSTPSAPTARPGASPSGKVDAETGTPDEGVTPPATDTLGAHGTASNDGWQLVLVALAALIATVLILTPSSRKNRR